VAEGIGRGELNSEIGHKGNQNDLANAGLRSRLFCALVPCLIFALTVLTFSPVLQNEFVNWDDIENLLENPNYRGLGWIVWAGPTFVRTPDGERIRTGGADGEVMVLRTPRTPSGISVDGPIAIDWRPGEPW